MKNAASLYLAVARARQLLESGAHIGAALEVASREYDADIFEVRRLVHRAQAGCDFAREQLARESTQHVMAGK
jgi:Flp pilus assembly protein TadB